MANFSPQNTVQRPSNEHELYVHFNKTIEAANVRNYELHQTARAGAQQGTYAGRPPQTPIMLSSLLAAEHGH